jgi:penicillin-binding protein 1C
VTASIICWPLGLAKDVTPEPLCHEARNAWTLNQAVPPTLPDRGRPGSLREVVLLDAHSHRRVSEACATDFVTTEIARWPSHLEAWLPADWLAKGRVPDWRRDCGGGAARTGTVAIRGLENGSVIRAPAGQKREVRLTLTTTGSQGTVYWMLDGTVLASQPSAKAFPLLVNRDGHHELTAIDDLGHHARVSFDARGFSSAVVATRVAAR